MREALEFDYRPEIDTGISYNASTNSIQALLDKMRKNKPKPGTAGLPPLMAYRGIPAVVGPPQITGLSKLLDDLISFADPRPRTNLGQFAPQGEGAPDPNAMYKTYGPPQQQKQSGISKEITQATLAAPLVGAGGTAGGMAVKGLIEKLKKSKLKKA